MMLLITILFGVIGLGLGLAILYTFFGKYKELYQRIGFKSIILAGGSILSLLIPIDWTGRIALFVLITAIAMFYLTSLKRKEY